MAQLQDTVINGTLSLVGGGVNDIEDVAEDIAVIKQLLQQLQNLFKPTLITDGLTIREGRCIIEDGGYCMIGNMCFFQIRIKTTTSFSGSNFWTFIDNMPIPKSKSVACSVSGFGDDYGAKTLSLDNSSDSGLGGSLVVHNGSEIKSGINLFFSGFYLTNQNN